MAHIKEKLVSRLNIPLFSALAEGLNFVDVQQRHYMYYPDQDRKTPDSSQGCRPFEALEGSKSPPCRYEKDWEAQIPSPLWDVQENIEGQACGSEICNWHCGQKIDLKAHDDF